MKKMLVLMVVAALVAGSAFIALADNGPAEIVLSAKMGNINFSHEKHQGIEADCTVCHHNGVEEPNCHSCHGVNADAADAKKVFHQLCKDCHKEAGGNAPVKCKGCHVK